MIGIERTVEKIISHVREDYPDKLSLVREKYDTKVNLVPVDVFYISEAFVGYRIPAIFVIPQSTDYNLATHDNKIHATDRIEVSIVAEDRNEDSLTRLVWRHAAALFDCLHQKKLQEEDFSIIIRVTGMDYSPLIVDESDSRRPFRKEARLTLQVERYEILKTN